MTDSTNTTSSTPNTEQSDVEGHGARVRFEPAAEVEGHPLIRRRNDESEAPADETAVVADESREADVPEVEGHTARCKWEPAAEVEGHPFRRGINDDAEAPADETTVAADESRESSEPEVEGHPLRRV